TPDPDVQKANELIAANGEIVVGEDGKKYVREYDEDGNIVGDYYVPNQNSVTVTNDESDGGAGTSISDAVKEHINQYNDGLSQRENESAIQMARVILRAKGIDPDDPANAQLLADEAETDKIMNRQAMDGVTGSVSGVGYKTFKGLKAYLGSPGAGNQWHHIVEQAQINANRAGFLPEEVNTVENIIALQSGKASAHSGISGLYSSKPYWTRGLTIRDWLATKSFEEQFDFGMNALKDYGTVVKDSAGKWVFTPFE
ncbi:hypothetical protein, partial [Propionispira raffinosivorans]|uniref:hypothetical protein n=1 Tax=Propionispira raffinosivorans TaxID=86959 RepID=UPI001B7FB952